MNNSKPMFSIIIPCYNCGQTIIETLESITTNKVKDYEVILIDDCSTDNTYLLVNDYIKNNVEDNIKLFKNRKNVGAGITRNVAIRKAKGKYILFLDADDILKEEALDILYEYSLCNYDAVLFDAFTKSNKYISMLSCRNNRENIIDRNEAFVYTRGCVWGKIFKRSIIIDNCIEFGDIKISEDFIFTKRALLKCESIFYLKKQLYVYNDENMLSLMHKYIRDDSNYELLAFNTLKEHEYKDELKKEFNSIYFLEIVYGYNSRILFSNMKYSNKRELFKKINSKYVVNDPYYMKYKIKYVVAHQILKLFYL